MRTILHRFALAASIAAGIAVTPVLAQQPPGPDRTIDAAERQAVIDGVAERVAAHYVFPEVGKKMAEDLRGRHAAKQYDGITSGRQFAQALTKDLREVCKDKHLRVRFSSTPRPQQPDRPPTPEELKREREEMARENFAFTKVERLAGNVGLLDFKEFVPAEMLGDTAAAAMTFLANSDAVIVDLRRNGGGSPGGVILLCSYFFENSTHLNDIYTRSTDSTKQFWSLPVLPGKKLVGKDVYVLTSARTFSGAEEFAYNLQSQKRATIVGETTGGGAHPTRGFRVTDHFGVGVPFARSINPVTKTNWEGTGVKPDVAVPADHALLTAHAMALKKAIEKSGGDAERLAELKKAAEGVQKELDALKAPPAKSASR